MARALELDEGDRHQPWAWRRVAPIRVSGRSIVVAAQPRTVRTRRCRPNWSRTTTPEYSLRTSTTT